MILFSFWVVCFVGRPYEGKWVLQHGQDALHDAMAALLMLQVYLLARAIIICYY